MLHNQKDLLIATTDLNALPVPAVGCDSSLSWAASARHLAQTRTPTELYADMGTLIKQQQSLHRVAGFPHLVITGGEPLIPKWQRRYPELFELFDQNMEITFETNGTYELLPAFQKYLASKHEQGWNFTFSVSPKLSISGEERDRTLPPSAV